MNKEAVLFHLKEALEELQKTIREIETEEDYGRGDFTVGMGHLYHHLNTAWNGQEATRDRHRDCAEKDFADWRKFPKDSDLMLDIT
jgi:hypothetical protein